MPVPTRTIKRRLDRARERPCLWSWSRLMHKTKPLWVRRRPSPLPPALRGGD